MITWLVEDAREKNVFRKSQEKGITEDLQKCVSAESVSFICEIVEEITQKLLE